MTCEEGYERGPERKKSRGQRFGCARFGAAHAAATKEVTGEIVDMMCYVDHNAIGAKHANCGEKCIKNGGPVGIVSEGKAMLVVGAHKPMNDELAPLAGKTVTLKGKMANNGGVTMLENAEIVKK